MVILEQVRNMVSEPFTEKLDLKHLFLLTGLVMVFTALWAFILAHVKSAAMELVE